MKGKVSVGEVHEKKSKGRECELARKMFLHIDLLKLSLNKNTTSLNSSLTPLLLTIRKVVLRGNKVKR